jgi:benzylsuccinate CoA-transferase BbsE subunit
VNTKDTPMSGVRVLDLANEFGVYCGKLLAGMGADVIKVEKPGGDITRNIGPFLDDEPNPDKSLFFSYQNTGKRSITLNLETRDGQEIFRKLSKVSDVVLETFPTGYMASLGLGYPDLKKLNPQLVMTSITPFGQTGSHKNWKASSEIIPCAMGGMMYLNGEQSMPPIQMGHFLVAHGTSIYATVGTLAALHNRLFTGEGEQVDISMQECVTSWLDVTFATYQYPPYQIPTRLGSQALMRVPSRIYPCQDGHFFLSGMGRWNLIVTWLVDEGIEVGDLADSEYVAEGGDELLWAALPRVNEVICELGAKYTKMELMTEGQKRGIPITIVADAKDVYEDPHLESRDYFVELEHPILGKIKYAGAPCKFSESPWQIRLPAPLIGQHNKEIYGELGFSRQDLIILRAGGVI